jgi:putrescine transport system ATP-binding protein
LRALQRATGAAFVMVTHDQAEALALADRIAVLDRGRVAQYGPPRELYERPATRFVAGFLGAANVLEGRVREDGGLDCAATGGVLRLDAPPARAPGALVAVALRPERIGLGPGVAPQVNGAAGRLRDLAFRGDGWVAVVVLAGGAALRVALPAGAAPPEAGSAVALAWAADALIPLED